ncbi:hypothetical protein [Halomarina rubra]|uniref:Uncharacterized protein n=1 Tax=Halomarina rubra TaxID=2071873 RepID=A0ABD6ARP1_9EURY|nr:hypothetical protein [Halomarina rubra]
MNSDIPKSILFVTISLLVTTPLIAGPVIGLADFTTEPWGEVSITEAPGSATIDQVNESNLRFDTPPVIANVSNVRGSPVLVYKVHIPELQYYNTGLQYLSESDSTVVLDTPNGSLSSEEVQNETYNAVVELELRSRDKAEKIHTSNITVEVRK